MDKTKLILPISIIIASIILGGFFYASQINKQASIERQQLVKLENEKHQQIVESENTKRKEQEKMDQVTEEKIFSNNLKCQTLLKDLRQRWNNVVGIYYDELPNTCIVKYTEKGITHESPIEDMQDAD